MNVSEAISRKRAVRRYKPEPLPEGVVRQILEAGRRSQSSKNSQPWQFIAIRERETLVALSNMGVYASQLADAALCVAIPTPDPKQNWTIMFDAGQAAAYMQLQGVELGVGSCVITLHHPEPSRDLLGLPDNLELHMCVAFGYPADPAAFEPAKRPGGRRALEEVVHFEHFNPDLQGS